MRLVPADLWAVMTICQEAAGEPYEGKVAIGEVIRTRMARRYGSDGTVEGTVLRAWAFSGWNTTDPNRIRCARIDDTADWVADSVRAWAESATSMLTRGAVLYFNPAGCQTPTWAQGKDPVVVIGNHHFYVDR